MIGACHPIISIPCLPEKTMTRNEIRSVASHIFNLHKTDEKWLFAKGQLDEAKEINAHDAVDVWLVRMARTVDEIEAEAIQALEVSEEDRDKIVVRITELHGAATGLF